LLSWGKEKEITRENKTFTLPKVICEKPNVHGVQAEKEKKAKGKKNGLQEINTRKPGGKGLGENLCQKRGNGSARPNRATR